MRLGIIGSLGWRLRLAGRDTLSSLGFAKLCACVCVCWQGLCKVVFAQGVCCNSVFMAPSRPVGCSNTGLSIALPRPRKRCELPQKSFPASLLARPAAKLFVETASSIIPIETCTWA